MATLIPGAAHRVPPEVLQYIFGLSITGSVENVDPAPASERSSRNQVLLNAAQVCRAWARSAQYLLFRDIFVGSRTVISQYRKIVETSSIQALLDALESLPNTNHVLSAHFEVGHGKIHQSPADTVLAPRYEGYNGRDSWDQPWVFLRWTMPALLLRFLSLCTNLQHLGLTFADHYCDCVHRGHVDADDYPNFPVMDSLRSLSFTCKFSGSLYESAQFSGPPVRLIVEMLARVPLLERLHIDTRTSFAPDAAKLQPLHMPRLRDLRIGGSIPPFLLRAKLPSLESFTWRNQSSESSQMDFLPSTLRSLSLGGDSLQIVPHIRRFPALRHLLVDCSDLQVEQSFRTVSWRNHERPPLALPREDGPDDILQPSRCYRWLGIWWDPKFTFASHVSQMAERAGNAVSALSMLGTTRTGLSPAQLRTVHIACTLSVLCYGAAVWYTGDKQKGRVDKLDVVLRRGLRHILGAFKTTPIDALYVEASIPPMRFKLQERLERSAIRIASFPAEHPIRQRLGGAWAAGANGTYLPPLPPTDSNDRRAQTRLQRLARLYPADGERVNPRLRAPWDDFVNDERWRGRLRIQQKTPTQDKRQAALAHKELVRNLRENQANLIAYTDGSLLDDRAGSGAALYSGRRQLTALSFGLGLTAETYDGELFALARAARSATQHAATINATHLWFFADNDAAVGRAFERAPNSGQMFSVMFAEPIEQFLLTDDSHRVTVAWVPGHENLSGQEASDALAKAGTRLAPSLPVSLTITRAKRAVSERLNNNWRVDWLSNERTSSYEPANRIPPSTRPTPHMRTLDKSLFARVLQCRTGHAFTGEYYAAIKKPERGLACACGAPLQTREHLLVECPEYERYRGILRNASPQLIVSDLLGTRQGIAALAKFLQKSGAFSRPTALDARELDE